MNIIFAAAAVLAAAVSAPAIGANAPGTAPVVATLAAAPVAAGQDRVVVRERTTVTRRNWHRPRYGWRSSCRTTVRYGERRRVCRRVRYRY